MLTQTAEYALRAMTALAMRPGESMTAAALADATRVPPDYLAKVLQQLGAAGLIRGRRGVGGGYALDRAASDVRLIDVINAVAQMRTVESCPLGPGSAPGELCSLHRAIDRALQAAIVIFEDMTIEDVLTDDESRVPLCEASEAKQAAAPREGAASPRLGMPMPRLGRPLAV